MSGNEQRYIVRGPGFSLEVDLRDARGWAMRAAGLIQTEAQRRSGRRSAVEQSVEALPVGRGLTVQQIRIERVS